MSQTLPDTKATSPAVRGASVPLTPAATLTGDKPVEKEDVEGEAKDRPRPLSSTAHADDGRAIHLVDWDGPNDPENPKNWKYSKKWHLILTVSCFTFISPISSSIIAPASEQVAADFGVTSSVVIAMMTSVFVLAYAFGPLMFGPLSEIYGRSRVLQLANLIYFAFNLACGFAQNKGQLIAFRFLAGLGGSAPLSVGGGVIGDCFLPEQRGQALAIYSLAPMLGPVVGPVIGAWIAEKSQWRWVFYSTTIADAFVQVLGILFLKETYAPVLLERKAQRIRKSMTPEKAESVVVRTVFQGADRHWRTILAKALVRPFALFVSEPIVQLLGVYMAFVYGLIYLSITTMPSIFQGIYGESVGIAGLNYIALGLGLSGASQINARTMDKVYVMLKKRNGGVGRPEFRLPSMVPATIFLPVGLLIAGWSAQTHSHWIGTDIGIVLIGAGSILNFQSIQTYVIDAFTLHAASALAATSFLRSLAGFGFPLFAPAMYNALGFGKGNTILACVGILIGCPAPWLFWHYGERIRAASRHAHKS
ncbi:major facilitator superfamily [Heterobasidion irregulare TC 32-1]|uniref:Major facilitator superfamily n=1 Tax=Heterobasidion irregulare (strain TC 32-1) TaxID=747525 RepID=W4KH74_HETIT|nr:major facilitator superfamily [Heterobasidion irregulare TC 32-1]ETW85069.1 major facilitator superfamily [Heterobasidion irregulare TC 32-1]